MVSLLKLFIIYLFLCISVSAEDLRLPKKSPSHIELFHHFTSTQLEKTQEYFSAHVEFFKRNLQLVQDLDGYTTFIKFSKMHVEFPTNPFFDQALREFIKGYESALTKTPEELKKTKLNKVTRSAIAAFEEDSGISSFVMDYVTGLNQTFFIAINKAAKENAVFTNIEFEAILENIKKRTKAALGQYIYERLFLALNYIPENQRYEFMRLMSKPEYKNAFYSYFDHQKRFIYKVLKVEDVK
jgi:hypothetical protein